MVCSNAAMLFRLMSTPRILVQESDRPTKFRLPGSVLTLYVVKLLMSFNSQHAEYNVPTFT